MLRRSLRVSGGDLRPLHAPGSVSRNEARNLYFGEVYSGQALSQLGTQLMNSICIGSNVAVYFDNQDLREDIHEELIREFGSHHVLNRDLSRLRIHLVENREPYLVFMKLLLWLYERVEAQKLLYRIVDLLKETEGTIYFAPGKEKINYSTIPLPRLDLFLSGWLETARRRKTLKGMRDSLYFFMQGIEESARRVGELKVTQNKLSLFVMHYNTFCAYLLRSGSISHESLRWIINLILELSDRYKVNVYLSFIKELTSL
jgi:hypothetical protein